MESALNSEQSFREIVSNFGKELFLLVVKCQKMYIFRYNHSTIRKSSTIEKIKQK